MKMKNSKKMTSRNKRKPTGATKSRYRNLIIIGNGFDRWQSLPTSYDEFREYYLQHIEEIIKRLGFQENTYPSSNGQLITDVELIYGDPFHPDKLPDDFFWTFETTLNQLDDQRINQYFGKTDEGLYQMQESVSRAQTILREAFGSWIASISISQEETSYQFPDDCYCINFNYTDTLQKRFGVSPINDYHIHGEADDPESLIFGHATHPELAFPELMEQKLISPKSQRLRGLYLIEAALHETDKAVEDNIDDLCEFMTLDGVHIEDIEDIYVLGHSFGVPDYQYFDFLCKATKVGCDYEKLSAAGRLDMDFLNNLDEDSMYQWIRLNVEYAVHHRERELGKKPISYPQLEKLDRIIYQAAWGRDEYYNEEIAAKAADAVRQRFLLEQAGRTKEVIDELCMLKGIKKIPREIHSVLTAADYVDGGHCPRLKDAHWHISYFSEKGKRRIEDVLEKIGCKEYTLYPGIDKAIAAFRAD